MIRTFPALIAILALTGPVAADRAVTTGFSQVIVAQEANTFTWTLINPSAPEVSSPEWNVLIWWLQPEGLPAPESWTAPDGWGWSKSGGGAFGLLDASRKYFVGGPAVEPGEQITFTYTVHPLALAAWNGSLADSSFVAHVAAVSGHETIGDVLRWVAVETAHGRTWFDTPGVSLSDLTPVPEPSGVLAIAVGLISSLGLSNRRRSG